MFHPLTSTLLLGYKPPRVLVEPDLSLLLQNHIVVVPQNKICFPIFNKGRE